MVRDPRINFQMVLNWQFCTILHLAGGGWGKNGENCSCFGTECCNMLQYAGEVGIQIIQGWSGGQRPLG